MKKILLLAAVLYSASAIAQTSSPAKPPMVGDKPLVQVKPKGAAKSKDASPADAPQGAAKSGKAASGKPKSMAQRLQACLDIDDGTKERLNCYDAVIAPQPNPKAKTPVKSVRECAGFKDEEERLSCFNGFVEKLPRLPS